MKIQLSISDLEQIVKTAKENKHYDNSLSSTVEIELHKRTDSQTGSDSFRVMQKSSYAECNEKLVGYYNF